MTDEDLDYDIPEPDMDEDYEDGETFSISQFSEEEKSNEEE